MGTSKPYQWRNGRRELMKPIVMSKPGSLEQIKAITDAADKLSGSLGQSRWKAPMTDPLIGSTTDATTRFCTAMGGILAGRRPIPRSPESLEALVSEVCRYSSGIHEAAVRRGVTTAAEQLIQEIDRRQQNGLPLGNDLFCLLFSLLHKEILVELLIHFMAESALPGIATLALRSGLGEWATERIARLLPNPCKEARLSGESIVHTAERITESSMGELIIGTAQQQESQ